ncbi:unnamed protein product [Symbiodinium sp. CCMP2456]|nr:unnamed protein product [Symbiodinium sp. CCMP2456]
MRSTSLHPDAFLYNGAITACEKSAKWIGALRVLREVSEKLQSDLVSHTACVSACEKGGQWTKSVGLLWSMPHLGLQPNTISFNAGLSACEKSGLWRQICGLLSAASRIDMALDVVSSTAATNAFARGWLWERAVVFFGQLPLRGIRTDRGLVNSCLNALDWGQQWLASMQTAQQWLGRMDAVSIGSLMSAGNKCLRWQISANLYHSAKSLEVAADTVVLDAAISAQAVNRRWRGATVLLSQARSAGLEPMLATGNALLASYSKASWPLVLQLLCLQKEMTLDVIAYNSALSSMVRWKQGLVLLRDMATSRSLDTSSYGLLVDLCIRGGQEAALRLLQALSRNCVNLLSRQKRQMA